MSTRKIDIVIVAYRSRDLTRKCLLSIRAHPPTGGATVWVVENGSRDGTAEVIRAEFPEVELIEPRANLGFAVANNMAIRRGNAPYVLALNPDTEITPGAIDHVLDIAESGVTIGIVGCRLEREDGTFDHASRRSFPTPLGALGHFTRIGRSKRAPARLAQYRAPEVESGPVDAVNGAFMLIRRRALDEVGMFDEGYWMYMEDLDLCYRFRQAGWTTWYDPDVTVLHVKGGTSGRHRKPRLDYAFHYGMLRFYRKHYAATRNPVLNLAVYLGIGVKFLSSVTANAMRRRLPTGT
jgi:hypothetical protein